jgi:hypothetical protein
VARSSRPSRVRASSSCSPPEHGRPGGQGQQREPADVEPAQGEAGVLDGAGVQSPAVGREQLQEQVLEDDREAEGDQHRGQAVAADGEVQQPPLEQVAEDEHGRHGNPEGRQGVQPGAVDDHQGQERGQDGEVAVGQVDQAHDPDEAEPGGEHGVQPAQQQPLDQVVGRGHARTPK